jgi:vacuolar-type H+-ATPase subunit E/Vma4
VINLEVFLPLAQVWGNNSMSYQNLFKALESQIGVEVEEVIASAKKRADAIARAAKREVDNLNKQLLEESSKEKGVKAKGQTSARELKLSKLMLNTKHDLFQQAIKRARQKLNEVPKKPEYQSILKKLIQEATADFPECSRIRVNTRDISLAQKIVKELNLKLEVEPTTDFSAGVIASSKDGRMSVSNTLELRLERLIPLITPQVAGILYG